MAIIEKMPKAKGNNLKTNSLLPKYSQKWTKKGNNDTNDRSGVLNDWSINPAHRYFGPNRRLRASSSQKLYLPRLYSLNSKPHNRIIRNMGSNLIFFIKFAY
jgi:hypothetical protein